MKKLFLLHCLVLLCTESKAQSIGGFLPAQIDPSGRYLFYLHGGIVQEQGVDAVSEYFGKYEYLAILDSLSRHGFQVISEARPKGTEIEGYASKVKSQIDTLLHKDVPPENIVVIGASLGAYITLNAAYLLQNQDINYVLLGLCSDYAINHYSKNPNELSGNFLSIYERSDSKGSCMQIFHGQSSNAVFKEIELNMGNSHAFLYKPYDDWIIPVTDWFNEVQITD